MAQIPDVENIWRRIEGLVDITATASGSSDPLGNGDTWVFTLTIANKAGAVIAAELDVSLYQNTVDTDHRILGGVSVDGSEWQVMGPWADWGASTTVGTTAAVNSVWKVYVRNISAGAAQTVLIRALARVVANTRTIGAA
jgi:hypothetical protein